MMMLMMGGLLLYLWKSGPGVGSAESVVASAPRSENAAQNSAVLANESHSRAVMLAEPVVTETTSVAIERESTAPRVEETSPGGEGDMVPVPESVLNGSAGSTESHEQEADAEEPITTLPFAELASAFDLPTIPTVSSEVSESSSAGKIAPHAVANLSLELDSSATNVSRFYEFRAKELTEGGSGLRTWQVLAVPAGNQAEDESQLGLFVIDELSQFRFLWQMNRPFPKKNAAQLANALLVLNSGDSTHTLQLRGVKRQERYRTQLFKKTLPIPLALENPPDEQKLVVRIQQLRGVDMTKTKAAGGTNNYGDRPSGSLHSRYDAPLQTKLNRLQSKDFDNQEADDGIELDDGSESESDVDGREDTEPGVAPAGEGCPAWWAPLGA